MKAILDLETGGFSITKNAICEIGIIIINDALEVVIERSFIIKPYTRPDSEELVSYKEDAMAIHGISMEEIEAGDPVELVCLNLQQLLSDYKVDTFIGHNFKQFDFPRLSYLFNRFSLFPVPDFQYPIIDTLELSREHLNLDCNKLGSICEHFGIEQSDSHRALGDCRATLEVYKRFKRFKRVMV